MRQKAEDRLLQGGFTVVVLAAWFGIHHVFPLIPTPVQTVEAFAIQVARGTIIDATINALYAIFIGYSLAILIGIPIGVTMGINRRSELFFTPYVYALYAIPLSAIVPAMIIWFGTGTQVRIVAVWMFAVFPILVNTAEGTKSVPAELVEVGKAFGANTRFLVRKVILYHQIPYTIAGLRLGFGRAIRGLVITELVVSVTGFGQIINRWSSGLEMSGVFSVALFLMSLGVISTWLLNLGEKHLVHWEISEA